ncbi:hypothetical protein ACKWTF_002206 [Chironomus riparius]
MRREIDENNEKVEVMGKNMDCTEEKVENHQKTIEQQAKLIKCQQSIINSLQQRNKSTQISNAWTLKNMLGLLEKKLFKYFEFFEEMICKYMLFEAIVTCKV